MRTLIIFLLLCVPCMAQKNSVAQVLVPGGMGSCVIIKKEKEVEDGFIGLAVTSYHVVCKGDWRSSQGLFNDFQIKYHDGSVAEDCNVIYLSTDSDLVLIRVWMPKSAEVAELADEVNKESEIEIHGFGYGQYGVDKGSFLRHIMPWAFFDVTVQPGDSGGGAFQNGKLVGITHGGWCRHFDPTKGTFDRSRGELPQLWPLKSSSINAIKKLLEIKEPRKYEPAPIVGP